jgi:methionyl aminopeptidase
MTLLLDKQEVRYIRDCGRVIKDIFVWLENNIKPGITTAFLDKEIEKMIRQNGGEPAFKGYKGYPSTICASVNEVVVHGIPSHEVFLREGDIVGVDVGVRKNGFFTDAARTFSVGSIDIGVRRLLEVTRRSLDEAVDKAVAGNRIGDISNVIQKTAAEAGYKEVRTFVGHGIGRHLHESPEVPNWGEEHTGALLQKGLLLAIEPMINSGSREVKVLEDGWTAVTTDGSLSAHFENTVLIGEDNAEILT